MGGLNLHVDNENTGAPSEKKRWYKSPKLILGIAALIAIPVLGTTFASTITVNTSSKINFGQGQQQAIACDSSVTVTPHTTWSSSGYFILDTVTVSTLNVTSTSDASGPGCASTSLTLNAYSGSDTTTVSGSTLSFTLPASGTTLTNLSGFTSYTHSGFANPATIAIGLTSPINLSSSNVGGFTIQQN
jgi:hypothetical protein